MKTFTVPAMACCGLFLGALDGARADQARIILSPPDTHFQIRGDLTLLNNSDPRTCKVTFSGTTSSGDDRRHAGQITAGTTKGSGCRHVEFLNFPWNISLFNKKGGSVTSVVYQVDGARCKSEFLFAISRVGDWVLDNPSSCGLWGDATATPIITIIRP